MKRNQKELREFFGVTYPQSVRLSQLNLSCEAIQEIFDLDPNFDEILHGLGVNSKPLRDKLCDRLKWT